MSAYMKLLVNFIYFTGLFYFCSVCFSAINRPSRPILYEHDIHSISIRGHAVSDELEMELSVLKKGHNKIKANLSSSRRKVQVTTLYNNERLTVIQKIQGQEGHQNTPSGDEAAGMLFDLIALNPEFTLKQNKLFEYSRGPLQGYVVIILRTEDDKGRPLKAQLFKLSDKDRILLRSVNYDTFKSFGGPNEEPTKLVFKDEETAETMILQISDITYNSGIPDFLFELPNATQQN